MAMRSGGGTGILVALIIFIFLTVGSATAAILLYGQKNTAEENAESSKAALSEVLKNSESGRDDVKTQITAARTNRKSLVGHLMERSGNFREFVTGDPNADETTTRNRFSIPENMTMAQAFSAMRQDNGRLNSRIGQLEGEVNNLREQLASRNGDVDRLKADNDQQVQSVMDSIASYKAEAANYRDEISKTQDQYVRAIDSKDREHRNEVADLQTEIDDLRSDHTVATAHLNELRKMVDAIRIRPKNPAELVDGRIIDVLGSSGQVFIDLGRNDRVKPGMTFQVYDDPGQIRIDPRDGSMLPEYLPGKASIQIIKVADKTATARVTRTSGSRPVVRDDVIANAVFNPEYRFKFLVYGKFDVDDNGSASESEADYIRSRIIEWGGEVVEGDQLTGDLDFVVLGEVPDYVSTELIPANATDAQLEAIMQKRTAYDNYEEIFQQALNAQIPILNWNRFRILTGEDG